MGGSSSLIHRGLGCAVVCSTVLVLFALGLAPTAAQPPAHRGSQRGVLGANRRVRDAVAKINDARAGAMSAQISFAPHRDVTVDGNPTQVAVSDLNADGSPDLVVGISQSFNFQAAVSVLLGKGDGAFQAPVYYPAACSGGGRGVTGVAVGDFTGDGIPDVAEALNCASELDVLPGTGDGGFGSAIASVSSGNATSITTADVNGDGLLDVAIGTVGPGGADPARVEVLFGNGDGSFTGSSDCNQDPIGCYNFDNTYGSANWLAARDISGDGAPDVIVTGQRCGFNAGRLAVYVNNGDGTFQDGQPYLVNSCPQAVGIGDFTGDGVLDLATTTGQTLQSWRAVDVLRGHGDGSFGDPRVTSTSLQPYQVASADLDGDGLPDLVGADGGGCLVDAYPGAGGGSVGAPSAFSTACSTPSFVAAADVNGDARPDVVALEGGPCCSGESTVSILLNTTPVEALTPDELIGGGAFCLSCTLQAIARGIVSVFRPVNTADGEFYHAFNDLTVPGRGLPLAFNRTYSTGLASIDGPLGNGWTDAYNMFLSFAGSDVTVHEANGSSVTFVSNGVGGYVAPGHDLATLGHAGGVYTYRRDADQVAYRFDGPGRLRSETDLNGYATTLAYNPNGSLSTVTDPAGRTLQITTGANGKVASLNDPAGRSVSFGYDANDDLTSFTDVGGGTWTFTYDAGHRMLTMTDPRGGTMTNAYDGSGRVTSQTDPANRSTTFAYTQNLDGSQTTLVTDPRGNQTAYVYANLLLAALTRGYGSPQAATTTYGYDPVTLVVAAVTDPKGHTTASTSDIHGNVLSLTDPLDRTTKMSYNAFGEVLTVTDPLGVVTKNTYDARGNLTSTTRAGATMTFAYGDQSHPGDLTALTDPNGHTTSFAYDAYGDRVSTTDPMGGEGTYTYDNIGRRVTAVSPLGNATGNQSAYTTAYTYDAFGDLTSVRDPLGQAVTYRYDRDQNLVFARDPSGNVVKTVFDHDGEPTRSIRLDANGSVLQTLRTTYDGAGNVVTQVDGLGRARTYAYDPLNRPSTVTDPLNRVTASTYDAASNLATRTDPQNRVTTFTYDAANQLTAVAYSDGVTPGVTYTYDADGQRLSMVDGTGATTYSYDSIHRLKKVVDGTGATVAYGHDAVGNLTTLAYPGGTTVTRAFDAADRLTSVTDWLGHRTALSYDADSNLTAEAFPNGLSTSLHYDRGDHLLGIVDARGATQLLSLAYTRNASDLVRSENATTYAYDGLNRLTAAGSTPYGYDAANELTTSGVATQAYDAANEVTSITDPLGTTTLGYDPEGNRANLTPPAGPQRTYAWDQANRLVGYASGTTAASYSYNGDGLRMSKTVDGSPKPFVWDLGGGVPLILRDGQTSYVTGPGGRPIERVTSSGRVDYYHQDQLGSTRMLTDASGHVSGRYTYDAYGAMSAAPGSVVQPFGFAGQYLDAESGLVYLRARSYDPTTGQFVSVDPAVAATAAPYAYASDDPTNLTDPTGLDPTDPIPPSDPVCDPNGDFITDRQGGLSPAQTAKCEGERSLNTAKQALGQAWAQCNQNYDLCDQAVNHALDLCRDGLACEWLSATAKAHQAALWIQHNGAGVVNGAKSGFCTARDAIGGFFSSVAGAAKDWWHEVTAHPIIAAPTTPPIITGFQFNFAGFPP